MSNIQLLAKGAIDSYLTNNPEISFFKTQYKKHTNFAIESSLISLDTNTDLIFNNNTNVNIPRNGDLINNIFLYLEIESHCIKKKYGWINNIGINIIDYIEFKIGNNIINKIDSIWLNIWQELTLDSNKEKLYNKLIGNNSINNNIMKDSEQKSRKLELYIPFIFFFNKSYGLSLPIIALQYINISVNIKLKDYTLLINHEKTLTKSNWEIEPQINKASLICDYIYLDTLERDKIAKSTHNILIEQVKHINKSLINSNGNHYENLKMYNLTKSIYWVFNSTKYNNNNINDVFLDINEYNATQRFVLICLFHLFNKNIKAGSKIQIIDININEISLLIINTEDNTIIQPVSSITFNKNYIYYDNIINIFSNVSINKTINIENNNQNIDFTYITIENNILLDSNILSLITSDIFKTVSYSTDKNNIFCNFVRNNLFGILSPNEDIKIHQPNNYGLYINENGNIMENFNFKMESLERVPTFDSNYFNLVQALYYSKNLPKNGIYQYSFSLYPDEHQPSGAANMTNISNIEFIFDINEKINEKNTTELNIYTITYNMLKITNGIGGIEYS